MRKHQIRNVRPTIPIILTRQRQSLGALCTPAYIYFVFATIGLILVAFQNATGDSNTLVVGSMSMYVPSVFLALIMKFIYILFWTWILNLICRDGASWVSWLIVLVPVILTVLSVLLMTKK